MRAICAFEPDLTDQQENGEKDAVCDESGSHDEVGQALTCVISFTSAEAQTDDTSEQHLHPGGDWHGLAEDTMGDNEDFPDLAHEAALDV